MRLGLGRTELGRQILRTSPSFLLGISPLNDCARPAVAVLLYCSRERNGDELFVVVQGNVVGSFCLSEVQRAQNSSGLGEPRTTSLIRTFGEFQLLFLARGMLTYFVDSSVKRLDEVTSCSDNVILNRIKWKK